MATGRPRLGEFPVSIEIVGGFIKRTWSDGFSTLEPMERDPLMLGSEFVKKTYRLVVDHLTKTLGAIGAATMTTLAVVDPMTIHLASQTYLGPRAAQKIGAFLFVLVIFRGWWTGVRAKQIGGDR